MMKKQIREVENVNNIKELVYQSEKLFGSKNAFLVKDENDKYKGITYSQFKNDMDALGTALIELGLSGKNIAVIGENRYKWCLTYVTVVNGVGAIVPLDKELPLLEIENLLAQSDAQAVIFSGKLDNYMSEIQPKLNSIKYFISMDLKEDSNSFISLDSLIKRGKKLISEGNRLYIDAQINNEAMSMLLFTSGTTGHAKGVMLSHKNICSNICSICSEVYLGQKDTALSILPLHHTYECTCGFLGMIYNGGAIAFNEGLRHIGNNLKEIGPTVLVLVPLLLENMYKKIWDQAAKTKGGKLKVKTAIFISNIMRTVFKLDIRKRLFKKVHNSLGGNVRLILTGAAAIDPLVSKGLYDMGIKVLQGYGLTECSPLVTGNTDKNFKHNSVGRAIPGVEIKVGNPNKSGMGEIMVKGPNVMLGYYKNEEETQKCIKDGWFYTGDIGYINKKGYYYITGRSKNVIVTKNGKNIFPEEVETYINKSPYVQESLVCGDYDEDTGETFVHAHIVPNFEAIKEKLKLPNISKDDILKVLNDVIKSVNKNMPLYKRVRKFTIRENEFVKTTTRKIKRYMESVGKKDSKQSM